MSPTLPLECVAITFAFIPERQYFSTLHSILLVNKAFCRLALPLLYKDPWDIIDKHALASRDWDYSTTRSALLLRTLIASFDHTLVPTGLVRDPWFDQNNSVTTEDEDEQLNAHTHPLYNYVSLDIVEAICRLAKRPPGSINYLAYVERRNLGVLALGLESKLLALITFQDPALNNKNLPADHPRRQCPMYISHPNSYQQRAFLTWMDHALIGTHHETVRSIRHWAGCHWPERSFWYQTQPRQHSATQSVSRLILPKLQEISFNYLTNNGIVHIVDFIRAHCDTYPGTLNSLKLESPMDSPDSALRELLQAYGKQLRHFDYQPVQHHLNGPCHNFITDPASLVSLSILGSLQDMDSFLAQCTSLRRLSITNPRTTAFYKAFYKAFERSMETRSRPAGQPPVFVLKELQISSSILALDTMLCLVAAVKAYSTTIEKLHVRGSNFYNGQVLDTRCVLAMPVGSSDAADTSAAMTFDDGGHHYLEMASRLELELDRNMLCRRFVQVQIETPMFKLHTLHLQDLCALQFSLWSLAACPGLRSLTLDLKGCDTITNSMLKYRREERGRIGSWSLCCVPQLRELRITGDWLIPSRSLVRMMRTRRIHVVEVKQGPPNTNMATSIASWDRHDREMSEQYHQHGADTGKRRDQTIKTSPTLPHLQTLDLHRCRGFSAKAFQNAVRHLPSLQSVTVSVHPRDWTAMSQWREQVRDRIHVDMDAR